MSIVLALLLLLAAPLAADAACNLIPGTITAFNGVLGTTNRPFAAPGERLEVALRSCDAASSSGLSLTATDFVVTVAFLAPGTGELRVLAPDADCTAFAAQLAACSIPPPTLTCAAGTDVDMQAVERGGRPQLGFRFPDTDDAVAGATDDRTLAGPVRIAVTRRTDPLPCDLATVPCASQSGLVACVDDFFANDGSCGTAIPNPEFASLTALPPPNDFQRDCFADPPCNPTATELRTALDASGNLLMPVAWQGILVPQARVPIPRLISAAISAPVGVPVDIPDRVFLTSFTPEGGRLGPIFEPQLDDAASTSDFVRIFGSADAPYTILRVARRHGTCSGGQNDGQRCHGILDCPGGTCGTSCVGNPATACTTDGECGVDAPCGALFDLSPASTQGAIYLDRAADRRCQLPPHQVCAGPGDCPGGGNDCVGYSLQANTPVPLDGLAASADLRSFVVTEAVDGIDRNGDGDQLDSVAMLRDRATGNTQALDAPDGFAVGGAPLPACGLAGTPEGRAAVRVRAGLFTFPAVAVEDDVLAFLESEADQLYCDENGDFDRDDAILRVFQLGVGEVTAALSPPRSIDAGPRIDGQSIAVASGQVFYRRPEAKAAGQAPVRASVGPGGVEGDLGASVGTTNRLALSADGRYVVFASKSTNLIGPGADTNSQEDVFVRDLVAGTTERVSVGVGGVEPLSPGGAGALGSTWPCMSADGRYVAFLSSATNLVGPGVDTNGAFDLFLRDRVGLTTERINLDSNEAETVGADAFCGVSADGRFVAFKGTIDGSGGVFVRDRQLGETERVSVAFGGGIAFGEHPAISADGRYVVFGSGSVNLLAPGLDTNGARDAYVYDRQTGVTERVSLGPNGVEGNGHSGDSTLTISEDGRYVGFHSNATNLFAGADTNGQPDAFVRDRLLGETILVNVGPGGIQGNGYTVDSTVSPDGRFVAFHSASSNLLGPGQDTNGQADIFVRDLESGVTSRASLGLGGSEVTYAQNGFLGVSRGGRYVAYKGDGVTIPGGDGNGIQDIYVQGADLADPLGADALFADGTLDDTVLEVMDAATAVTTTLCPAEDVAVASNATAVFLRPESAAGTVACPGGSLNPPDADTDDQIVQLWPGSGAVTNLARAATAVAVSTSGIAASVSECGTAGAETDGCTAGGTDLNADGDAADTVVQVNALPGATAGTWVSINQAGDALAVNGAAVAFLTAEAAQGAGPLNGDGDATDRVLQVYSLAGAPLACTPTGPGAPSCVAGVRIAAEDFVMGTAAATDCGTRQLVAFRTREAAQNATNLNGGVGTPVDADTLDDVLQVYDVATGTLKNVRQAVTPCFLSACDPRRPYKVEGSKVTFLTFESEQGGQLLSVDNSSSDLVIQVYDFCTDTVTTVGRVDIGGEAPLDVPEDTHVFLAPAGRCDLGIPCTVDADCGEGAFCDLDTCDPLTAACTRYTGLACAVDADCRRCILRQPATCRPDAPDDCPTGTTCQDTVVVAVTVPADQDDDGVPDGLDDCPTVFDPLQADVDGDGVGDACDVQSCGDGAMQPDEECDDGNAESNDGCSSDCLHECETAPLAGCLLPAVGQKASLQLKDKTPDKGDQVSFKWQSGAVTPKAAFGAPLTTDRYQLCIYDAGGLKLSSIMPAGGICAKGKPCWKDKPTGFDYKDNDLTPQGAAQLVMREGLVAGKAKLSYKGKGDRLPMPASLATLATPIRAQIVNHATGTCWEAVFSAPFQKQDATQLKDKAD